MNNRCVLPRSVEIARLSRHGIPILICSNPDRKHDEDNYTMQMSIVTRGFGNKAASAEFHAVFLAVRAETRGF